MKFGLDMLHDAERRGEGGTRCFLSISPNSFQNSPQSFPSEDHLSILSPIPGPRDESDNLDIKVE